MNGKANVVPSTADAIVFRCMYLTEKGGTSSGGFYPKGMNGTLKST